MLVKDYKGDLIPKEKAKKIKNKSGQFEYYEIGVSCVEMPDGKYYRTTTGEVLYDNSALQWVHAHLFKGNRGLLKDGTTGYYSDLSKEVNISYKAPGNSSSLKLNIEQGEITPGKQTTLKWARGTAIDENVAIKNGFKESLYDGIFYKVCDCNKEELERLDTFNIPNHERSSTYSLDDDKAYRSQLEKLYDEGDFKLSKHLKRISKKYIPFTFGTEIEVQNGHVPQRVREPLGYRNCRDGSLDNGIEYVSIPMHGAKGLAALQTMCKELTRRCQISNKCSVHIHFGDVRRDRLYVVSLWQLLFKVQDELKEYFPYSRTHSIREDGKIYAAPIPDLKIITTDILDAKTDKKFKSRITEEFIKIYTWLNNNTPPGKTYDEEFVKETRDGILAGKPAKLYCYRVKKHNYSTRVPRHAIQGHKWQRPQRYLLCNFLNFFFAHSKTIEFRIHEATTNFDKIFIYLLTCVAILKYAENFSATLGRRKITLKEVITDYYDDTLSKKILKYWETRKELFCNTTGGFKSAWKDIEANYLTSDKKFAYNLE